MPLSNWERTNAKKCFERQDKEDTSWVWDLEIQSTFRQLPVDSFCVLTHTNKSALFPLLKFLIATLFAEDKMRMKLHFQVFFLVYFSSTVAHSQGKKKAGDGNAKSVNLNEVANSQAIVCYDYTEQVSFSCHFEEYKYIWYIYEANILFLDRWPISGKWCSGGIVEARLWQQDWILLLWRLLDSLCQRQLQ